jgi:phage terminase large subunit-like protein
MSGPISLADFVRARSDKEFAFVMKGLAGRISRSWKAYARPAQWPPAGEWRTWLIMAGRGFGKTRAGAEWINQIASREKGIRIALVGATVAEVRNVMIEGESGILAACRYPRPRWEPARGMLSWPGGSRAFVYSGESPEGLRGPQHHAAWCDEIAKWAYPDGCWDNLQLGLRLGSAQRVLVTTTPRPVALLRRLIGDPATVVARGATHENPALSPDFVARMAEMYGGTRLGRQELDGELIEDAEGALWPRSLIESRRVRTCPGFARVVIGVDPPA